MFFARTVRVDGLDASPKSTHRHPAALLLVDFWGHAAGDVSAALRALLKARDLEFASLLCHVPQEEYFLNMGFDLATDAELLPVYYEPFVRQNSPIFFALKSPQSAAFFKGDSDQDRPNRPPS